MTEYLKINNWSRWQSYRADRGQPPWIKVHRCVMRNPEWVALTDTERGQLVSIWLLAADNNGLIPSSPSLIQKLCFMSSPIKLNKFIELGFICQSDAKTTPERRQDDQPEKRRVEESRGEENRVDISSELKNSSKPIVSIPLVNKTEYAIHQKDINAWQESYPAVDILQALRSIREWNISNPIKQKTPKGIRKHITTWLDKEQNKGGQNGFQSNSGKTSARSGSDREEPDKYSGLGRTMLTE